MAEKKDVPKATEKMVAQREREAKKAEALEQEPPVAGWPDMAASAPKPDSPASPPLNPASPTPPSPTPDLKEMVAAAVAEAMQPVLAALTPLMTHPTPPTNPTPLSPPQSGAELAGSAAGMPGVPAEMASAAARAPEINGFQPTSPHGIVAGRGRILVGYIKKRARDERSWVPVEIVPDIEASIADFSRRGNTTELSPHGCHIREIGPGEQIPRLQPWPLFDLPKGGVEAVLERYMTTAQMQSVAGADVVSADAF